MGDDGDPLRARMAITLEGDHSRGGDRLGLVAFAFVGVVVWLVVRSRREADMLVLEVADDGPGFPGGWGPASSGGIGLANTRERLERLYDGAYRFDAGAREGGGARVTIRIPFRLATR